jgi:hypothetical protein
MPKLTAPTTTHQRSQPGPAATNQTFGNNCRPVDVAPRNTAAHRGYYRLPLLALASVVVVVGFRQLRRAVPVGSTPPSEVQPARPRQIPARQPRTINVRQ